MTTTALKRYLGEAGAAIDQSHGADRLYDVLKAIAEGQAEVLTASQATIATAVIAGMVVDKDSRLDNLRTYVETCGSANTTTLQVHKNGASVGELSTAHDDTDGTAQSLALAVSVAAGDVLELVVSAAPTAGSNLIATARLRPIDVE